MLTRLSMMRGDSGPDGLSSRGGIGRWRRDDPALRQRGGDENALTDAAQTRWPEPVGSESDLAFVQRERVVMDTAAVFPREGQHRARLAAVVWHAAVPQVRNTDDDVAGLGLDAHPITPRPLRLAPICWPPSTRRSSSARSSGESCQPASRSRCRRASRVRSARAPISGPNTAAGNFLIQTS